jgi:hypothetical protein
MNSLLRSDNALRIIVLGYVVRYPLGGMVWSNLHYLMGLLRLGHDVWYVEDSGDYPSCYDPSRFLTDANPGYGLDFAKKVFDKIGLGGRWAFHDSHTSRWLGESADKMLEICSDADVVLNLACSNPLRPWLQQIPVRAYVDEDPAFTQIRRLIDPAKRKIADQHNVFFSFGENIERASAKLPFDGIHWRATRQPIVTELFPSSSAGLDAKLTTVMQWRSYPPVEYDGIKYGVKAEAFEPFMDLPQQVGPIFELAIGSSDAPRTELREKGWALRDPMVTTKDPWTYEDFIRGSRAEFGIAKHGYIISNSGWFSERSCCYLAFGRPVLAQESGFSEWMNTGEGVLPFSSPDEAVAAIDALNSRYEVHCRVAREIAREYFDYRQVLPRFLDTVMNCAERD